MVLRFINFIIWFSWGIIFIINLFKDFLIKVLILFHVIKRKFSFGETIISMHEAVSNVLPIEHYGSSFWRHKYNTNEIYLFGVLCTSKCLNRYKLWERIYLHCFFFVTIFILFKIISKQTNKKNMLPPTLPIPLVTENQLPFPTLPQLPNPLWLKDWIK